MAYLSPRKTRRNTPPTLAVNESEKMSNCDAVGSSAVVLSNFPPNFTRHDLEKLFAGFRVVDNFTLPKITRFAYPLRTTVILVDQEEALRATKVLHGISVGGRRIAVRVADESDAERTTALIEDLAAELTIGIISGFRHTPFQDHIRKLNQPRHHTRILSAPRRCDSRSPRTYRQDQPFCLPASTLSHHNSQRPAGASHAR
jgi:hypothetical protein